MNANFDPYREALVVETNTLWPPELAPTPLEQREAIEARLHAAAHDVEQLEYVRLPTGFCRQITVTAADLERVKP